MVERRILGEKIPAGAAEEEYELSTSTIQAIRFVAGLTQPHSAATESRLALVIQALVRLAEETETDVERRVEQLYAERQRIDRQIEEVFLNRENLQIPSDHSALERAREIIIHRCGGIISTPDRSAEIDEPLFSIKPPEDGPVSA